MIYLEYKAAHTSWHCMKMVAFVFTHRVGVDVWTHSLHIMMDIILSDLAPRPIDVPLPHIATNCVCAVMDEFTSLACTATRFLLMLKH